MKTPAKVIRLRPDLEDAKPRHTPVRIVYDDRADEADTYAKLSRVLARMLRR